MTPKAYMLIGALIGLVCAVLSFVPASSAEVMVLAFGGGMLFGKGYGLWESRAANKAPPIHAQDLPMITPPVDIAEFFVHLARTRQAEAPIVDKDTAETAITLLREGFVSARRMAREMDATIEQIDATFAHHGLGYRVYD